MRVRKIRFANRTSRSVYVSLLPNDGRLEIHIHDQPGENRERVMSRQRITVLLSPYADDCVVDGTLLFTIIGHCSGPMLQLPTDADPDGPVFTFVESDA